MHKFNFHEHQAKIEAYAHLCKAVAYKDEACSEINKDHAEHFAKIACNCYHDALHIMTRYPVIEDALKDHSLVYEMKHFARKWGH